MGTFGERMDELRDRVGDGDLEVTVVVDQVYAQYQHEGLDLNHPRGGQAKYLSQPLVERAPDYIKKMADTILDDGGESGAVSAAQDLVNQVYIHAPVEFNDLKNSGAAQVHNGNDLVYDQPPNVPRLNAEELKAKGRLRDAQ